jgi:hypothetical protein
VRTYRKSWQNRRPGWTRRVRWFEGPVAGDLSIRLCFEDYDEGRKLNRFYTSIAEARAAYETFIAGASVASFIT